ncbi:MULTISPECIES: hypothetical protein [unclassified Sporosarcina]|uniref:hypothetical protein n=1 Tax=unclassified Sporosarcina TaxID=2647733 RepID=UPI00203F40E2|nr:MULTISPECIES: hypothetical protein [unclassified Sporosarcina]GKV65204.1 hypothetical protein NCCP2331_13570 [Sporosarcina sp. NCCP-2331]GLB55328.1 hypothetical protein NCCP2378_11140 [Sporosarcina sp. NCCP-2378]
MFTLGHDVNRLRNDFYMYSTDHQFMVTETSGDGLAEVDIHFSNRMYQAYYQLQHEKTHWLQYTVNAKCPDGIFVCIFQQDGVLWADFHIVELKTTLTSQKWSEVLQQFRGGVLRALSFCGTLGIEKVREVHLYSCAVDKTKIENDFRSYQAQYYTTGGVSRKRKTGVNYNDLMKWGQPILQLFYSGGKCTHQFINLTRRSDGVNIGTLRI